MMPFFWRNFFNPELGGLFRGSFGGGEGGKITYLPPHCLKLVRIMLETEIWHASTHTWVVSENIPFSTKTLSNLLMLAFFSKKSAFFGQNNTSTQNNSVRAVLEMF